MPAKTISKYAQKNPHQANKRPYGLFVFIIIVFIFSVIYNLPKMTVNWNIFNIKINSIGGYTLFGRSMELKQGLDLQGGVQVTLQADMSQINEKDKKDALEAARNIIERRVNIYGVAEPVVQSSSAGNEYRIIVEMPGVTDVNQALTLIGKTAKLEFRELDTTPATESAELKAQLDAMDATQAAAIREYLASQPRYKPTELTGKQLKRAEVTFNQNTGEPEVALEFKPDGAKLFADLTTKYVGKTIAIYLDGELVSAPTVNTPILDGRAVITGGFTVPQARELATQLNAGALPVPVKVIEQRTIGATLGQQSVEKSITAGIIGLSIVALFMIAMYKLQGLIAVAALILYTLLTLVIFRLVPVTLTLAGIAGFILSIGMALDANILIFERMREEIRWGRSKREALKNGFERAWLSIRDSNTSSLMTCAILYGFGTGLVRGFAITLAIGIIISMFTAITVSKTLLRMIYK